MIDASWVRGPEPPKKKGTQRTEKVKLYIFLLYLLLLQWSYIYSYIPNRIVILLKEKITSITEMVLLPPEAGQQSQQILYSLFQLSLVTHNLSGMQACEEFSLVFLLAPPHCCVDPELLPAPLFHYSYQPLLMAAEFQQLWMDPSSL